MTLDETQKPFTRERYLLELKASIKHNLIDGLYSFACFIGLWIAWRSMIAPPGAKELTVLQMFGVMLVVSYFPVATMRMIRYVIKHPEQSGEKQLNNWQLREISPIIVRVAFGAFAYWLLHLKIGLI